LRGKLYFTKAVRFVADLLSGLVAYHFIENKPKIDLSLNVKSDIPFIDLISELMLFIGIFYLWIYELIISSMFI